MTTVHTPGMIHTQLEQTGDRVYMDPPRGAHPVEAPFQRKAVNDSITGNYIVEIATVKPAPDVDIRTINGLVDIELYFLGGLPRRIGVLVQSTNGEIRLALPEQQHAQHLDVRVQNVNGATYLALPETYKGYLRLSSSNGNLSLGEALGRNSKLISGGGSKDLIYYVSPSSKDTVFAQDEKSAFGELEDNCHCHSVSGRIRVGYYGSLDDLDTDRGFAWMKEDDTGCCIVG